MNWVLAVPIEWRLVIVFAAGAYLGALANRAAVRLAWQPRSTGSGFPIRALVVAWLFAAGLAALYWWEIQQHGLLPAHLPAPFAPHVLARMHAQWLCHVVLAWLMLVASLVDADEKQIPDAITVPGTLVGLLVASVYPLAMLPVLWRVGEGGAMLGFLELTSPHAWPRWLEGFPRLGPLALALACWWLWCMALMHRTWHSRRGWYRALQLMLARLAREPSTGQLCVMGLAGTIVIGGVWLWGTVTWKGLLTALIGMAASGGLVWLVRVIGSATLKREAMGFGDVTLMGMIGAFLGWQSGLVIFFLAPLAALVIGLVQLVLRREREIPYGPFLCLATVVLIVRWSAIWAWLEPVLLILGGLVPLFVAFCLVAMAGLLAGWRAIRGLIGRDRRSEP